MLFKYLVASAVLTVPSAATSGASLVETSSSFSEACKQLSRGIVPSTFEDTDGLSPIPTTKDGGNLHMLSAFMRSKLTPKDKFESSADFQLRQSKAVNDYSADHPYLVLEHPLSENEMDYDADAKILYFDRVFGPSWSYFTPTAVDGNKNYVFYFGAPRCYGPSWEIQTGDCRDQVNNPFRNAGRFRQSVAPEEAKAIYQGSTVPIGTASEYAYISINELKAPYFFRRQISTIVEEDVIFVDMKCIAVYDRSSRKIVAFWKPTS